MDITASKLALSMVAILGLGLTIHACAESGNAVQHSGHAAAKVAGRTAFYASPPQFQYVEDGPKIQDFTDNSIPSVESLFHDEESCSAERGTLIIPAGGLPLDGQRGDFDAEELIASLPPPASNHPCTRRRPAASQSHNSKPAYDASRSPHSKAPVSEVPCDDAGFQTPLMVRGSLLSK